MYLLHCLIQQNYVSGFEMLTEDANEKLIPQKCIEICMIEVYKYLNGLSWYYEHHFQTKKKYLCSEKFLDIWISKSLTETFVLDIIANSATEIWKNILQEIRKPTSFLCWKIQ